MKTTILIFSFIILLAFTSSKPKRPHFRNAFKPSLSETKIKPSPRIQGGALADPHSIPYQVLLEFYYKNAGKYCGGTLISQNYVLTSAWCAYRSFEVLVTIGAHFINRQEVGRSSVYGEEMILHENYNPDNLTNDIAVIKLPETIQYSDTVKPVQLPKRSDADTNYQGVVARVSGWGSDEIGDPTLFEVIRYSFVEIVDNQSSDCDDLILDNALSPSILCTLGRYEGKDVGPCTDDEGGPLILNGVQIGIISYGYTLWWSGDPAAHSRVASFLDWIEANTDVVIN